MNDSSVNTNPIIIGVAKPVMCSAMIQTEP